MGLLLVNDHVLKAAYHSWVTGKLSDFAGLFFFPFLLIAIGALPAAAMCERQGDRLLPRVAFAWTAAWFAAIKLWPVTNMAMAGLLGWLLKARVAIALDATDVMALVVLWPAWGLWRRVGQPEPLRTAAGLDWKGLAALALAGAATLATSYMTQDGVVGVAAIDGELYVALNRGYADDPTIARLVPNRVRNGFRWDEANIPEAVAEQLREEIEYPRMACDPGDERRCYRVSGSGPVEQTLDGGETWTIAWQVPPERQSFVEHYKRMPSVCGVVGAGPSGPYDVTFARLSEGTAVVVAVGNQGLLMQTAAGDWKRVSVGVSNPIPFASSDPFIIWQEIRVSLLLGLEVLFGLIVLSWRNIIHAAHVSWRAGLWPVALATAGLLILVASFGYDILFFYLLFATAGLVPFAGMVLLVLGFSLGWANLGHLLGPATAIVKLETTILLGAGLVAGLPISLFYAWSLGWIPWYEVTLVAAVVCAGVSLYFCGRTVIRMTLPAKSTV